MGFFADIGNFFNTLGENIVNFIVSGAEWVKTQLRNLRAAMIVALQQAMSNPWSAIFTILGVLLAQVVLQQLFDALKKIEIVAKITAFIANVGNIVKNLASALMLDTIFSLVQIGALLSDGFYAKLARVYGALGDVALELDLDLNFITAYAETNRSVLYALHAVSGNSWLKAESDYAEGLSTFLEGLSSKLGDYARDPAQIFMDMQKAIIVERLGATEEAVGKVWAAIDESADWIRDTGNTMFEALKGVEAAMGRLPQEVQDTIQVWYAPMRERLDTFIRDQWDVFWRDYQSAEAIIDDNFRRHGMDIDYLQQQIQNPIEMLRSILHKPEAERAQALADLDEVTQATVRATLGNLVDGASALDRLNVRIAAIAETENAETAVSPGETTGGGFPSVAQLPVVGTWNVGDRGPEPYGPGEQKADGRSWYVG